MTKLYRIALAVLCAFSAASVSAANPPKVVFIGDYLTANWTYPANPNWFNLGVDTPDILTNDGNSGQWVQNFQTVLNLHPDIVHIMVGAEDAALEDDGTIPVVGSVFAQNIQQMVQLAKSSNIKIILGTTPPSTPGSIGITEMNGFIQQYGAANGITVVNYADALCGCIGSTGAVGVGNSYPPPAPGQTYHPSPLMTTTTSLVPGGYPAIPIPTADGYALMTQMVENAIATTMGWIRGIDRPFRSPQVVATPQFQHFPVTATVSSSLTKPRRGCISVVSIDSTVRACNGRLVLQAG